MVFKNPINGLHFQCDRKRSLTSCTQKRQHLIYRFGIAASRLSQPLPAGQACYLQSCVTFVCLILETHTQLDSAFHVLQKDSVTCRLGYRIVNCMTLQVSGFAQTLRVGSVLIVGTLVILNSHQMLTCAGHVQVQRDKISTLGSLGY